MKLDIFEKEIDPKIVSRGQQYFAEGMVSEIWQPADSIYRAVVDGAEPYDVEIHMASEGEVESAVCDCPYDWGPYCKHEVAVLLAIRGHLQSDRSWPSQQTGTKQGLRRRLEALGKDELVDLLLEFAKDYSLRAEMRDYLEDCE